MNGRLGCLQVRRTLQSFLDGEVEPQRAELVAAHLESCSRCHVEADMLANVIEAIRRLRPDLDLAPYTRLVDAVQDLTEPHGPGWHGPETKPGPFQHDQERPMTELSEQDQQLCDTAPATYDDLSALFINCTLKPSPEPSHTQALADRSIAIMRANRVTVDQIRAVDHHLAPGVQPDMTEHGADRDDWPALFERVAAADILVLMTPIWLGEKSSVATRVVERLYGNSGQLNDAGQYAYYGRTGGVIVTGNEDGAKHCAMNLLYSLQHLGYVIPPQSDAAWLGEAGPGPSYADEGSGGPDNDFTNRNTTFMTWNLLHTARWLKDVGGFPAHGNQRELWDAGCRFDAPNPEHR